jgi:tetratricopeptide (TPR) repeat protein
MTRIKDMRFTPIMLAVLVFACLAWAQQPGTTAAPASPQASGSASGSTAGTAPKAAPQAKSQAEFDAYKAAMNSANDPAAMEKAANDFSSKFPKSELTPILYRTAMRAYQNANNSEKMEQMGRKVLASDADDPEALIAVAEVIVERTQDTDLDRDQKLDEANKFAQHAVMTIETDVVIPAGTPPDKVSAYKGFLRSTAYSVLGTVAFNRQKYADAENYFQQSLQAFPAQPDPIFVLRLALTLDKENRYADALKQANHAVELTQESSQAGKLARQERDRLTQLTGAGTGNPSAPSPPPAAAPKPH